MGRIVKIFVASYLPIDQPILFPTRQTGRGDNSSSQAVQILRFSEAFAIHPPTNSAAVLVQLVSRANILYFPSSENKSIVRFFDEKAHVAPEFVLNERFRRDDCTPAFVESALEKLRINTRF